MDVDITMSCRIEVDAESEEQAKTIVGNWIGDDPWHFVKDGHYIKHEFEEVSECSDDQLTEYSEYYRKGIAYVKEQMDDFEKDIIRAEVNRNYAQHNAPSTGLDDSKIIDLLEEYGEDHELPEGWYLDEYDADDVMLML